MVHHAKSEKKAFKGEGMKRRKLPNKGELKNSHVLGVLEEEVMN